MTTTSPVQTDFVLVQLSAGPDAAGVKSLAGLPADFARFCAQSPLPMKLHRIAWSAATQNAYAYARLDAPGLLAANTLAPLAAWWVGQAGWGRVRVSRLEKMFEAAGRSAGAPPVFHYIVEMDPEEGWMPEISRWYDTEHMPGLASVEGCILAMRLLNHDHGPLSLACYDLVTDQALTLPAWLAVRGTAWSDITRPHFTNTLRTMFDVTA